MKIYLAGVYSRPFVVGEYMKIYIAESGGAHKAYTEPAGALRKRICILESFYYIKDWMIPYINNYWDFMLDSGAYTFMTNSHKTNIDWDKYVEAYADFINKNNIKRFFELDIDSVIGLDEVVKLTAKLERLTNKQSIPVWHRSRGEAYWDKMIDEYSYVSIGGIVAKEITQKDYPVFGYLINKAKKKNCKVHGLGFTNIKGLFRYPFHSVDSTAWIYGNRGGFLYRFRGGKMDKIQTPEGLRLKPRETAIHNFNEWIKFSRYAERCL